ncbi:S-layer homology domain-containing protein [Dielma fastidiosa]|uniref:S-layer homology domain-containing protein n=1 Tax=Dielma fastidiosa TaxID=1034346 RepID=A0AB35UT32_9FIRM|nr:S-layer homology domain-containing protein [Dielma fastidiosa]MDY5169219.1 S-layer homology domain-containing protein [Dielma fastidiosa]
MKRKRIRALLLSTALVITQLPMVIMADDFKTENTLVKSITDWTFINDEQLNNGNLNLDNISKENQFSFDEVVAMLPTAINAYIEDEVSPSTIGIVGWSCDPFIQDPEDNWPLIGDYTFVAELANGYTLASEASAIEVKVLLSGTNTYTENNYIEQGGIKIIYDNGGMVTYTEGSGFTLIKDGSYIISGTWSGNLSASAYNSQFVITVPFGVTANVTLDSVTINVNSTDYAGAFLVTAGGTANIAFDGMNILTSGSNHAGLEVPENATLTLKGGDSDSLEATGGGYGSGAGIGGGESANSGKIAINGGNITANGASRGAGIGGGGSGTYDGGSGGTIIISDGTVIANGSNGGAGIGGGGGGNGGSSGTIIIRNGTVTATGDEGAGIGGGNGRLTGVCAGDGDKITISGGTVTAMSRYGAGIGGGGSGGSGGSGGAVEIFGQNTTVTVSSSYGFDVGGGYDGVFSFGTGGSLSVTDGATLIMKNNGTNVSNPIYQNCTIIDKNGNRTEYNSNITLPTSSSGSIPKDSYKISGNSINQSITRTNLRRLANAGKSLTLESDMVVMSFDPAALKAILANTTGSKVTFTVMPADLSKSPEIKTIIDSHPAYDFSITYKNNKGVNVPVNAEFPAGSAAIQLNYTPLENESLGSLFIVYIDDKSIEWLNHSSYHNGFMMAGVDHFSTYAIAYKISTPTYTDITDHWAKNDIEFAAARDLFTVSKTNEFSPNTSLTYAELITALGKLTGIQPEASVTDIKADAAYAPYIDWAIQENIIPNRYELFNLNAPITREQMADVMMNYAKQIGYTIPDTLVSMPFTDKNLISKESEKAVTALYQAGIIKGKDGNRFDPLAYVNRAEGSAMLHRFVEIMIDPDTANGWVRNDSGHWLYYQAGNILTGWQTIDNLTYYFNSYGEMHEGWKLDSENEKWYFWTNDGAVIGWKFIYGKWYFFYEDGSMAANTIIEGYQLGSEGSIIYN